MSQNLKFAKKRSVLKLSSTSNSKSDSAFQLMESMIMIWIILWDRKMHKQKRNTFRYLYIHMNPKTTHMSSIYKHFSGKYRSYVHLTHTITTCTCWSRVAQHYFLLLMCSSRIAMMAAALVSSAGSESGPLRLHPPFCGCHIENSTSLGLALASSNAVMMSIFPAFSAKYSGLSSVTLSPHCCM